MKRSRFSEEQIIAILKEQEAGMATAQFAAATGSARRRFTSGRRSMAGLMSRMPASCVSLRKRTPD